MPRNDSSLYTAQTSASLRSERASEIYRKRKEQAAAKDEKRVKLSGAADVVLAELDKEVHDLIYGPYEGEDQMSDEQFRVERRARRIAVESLGSVKVRLMNTLRQQKRTEPKSWEEAADAN